MTSRSKTSSSANSSATIGLETSFTPPHFYQPQQLRTLAQIIADILALEKETGGPLHEITKRVTARSKSTFPIAFW